jgi:hypothetical protein
LELGQILWQKVHVCANDPGSLGGLSAFFKQKPAVHSSLKSLELEVTSETIEEFGELCHYLSTTVVLDSLFLKVRAAENDLEDLKNGGGCLQPLLAAREIDVLKDVRLWVKIPLEGWDTFGNEAANERYEKLEECYDVSIKALIMPDTLRRPSTEVDEYLATRLQL